MNSKSLQIFAAVFLTLWARASPDEDVDEQNLFIDEILALIRREIDNRTSVSLPDYEHHFARYTSVLVRDAQFLGLEDLCRDGDADVHAAEGGNAMVINSDFMIGGIKGRFASTFKIVGLKLRSNYHFSVERVRLGIGLYYRPMEEQVNITRFRVSEFRGVGIAVAGLGPLNPIVEKMLTITTDILENFLARYIGETVERFSKQKVYYIPLST